MNEAQPISRESQWHLRVDGFQAADIALNGNRFMLGNGYLGYRGTLEEFGSEEQVGCMLNGVYDQAPGKWREPVNAPNGFYTRIEGAGEILAHEQILDMRQATMSRRSIHAARSGPVTVSTRRFVSQDDIHLLCMEYTVRADAPCRLRIHTGIDTDVWDINGPHLGEPRFGHRDGILSAVTETRELGITVAVCEAIDCDADTTTREGLRTLTLDLEPGTDHTFRKFVAVFTSLDEKGDPAEAAHAACLHAKETGFDTLLARHSARWDAIWERSDVRIDGDDEAQFALRYSLYQLQLAAPRHSARVSIPARGLSGQVYKGAVFWDTEMFMTPVFSLTEPKVARNLILYRYHTLDGARRKAAEYGFRGAFYAWESQETGDDACTHFNVTDVFTGRPMRTYFRDKQIHITADIAFAIRHYLTQTGDFSILADGAAEIVSECARFLYSYACYKPDLKRFELHDVTGPDEYHERVNNNAYTNRMAKFALDTALELLALLKQESPDSHQELESRIHFEAELEAWRKMSAGLYVPGADPATGIIPQFDGHGTMEDVSLPELKSRVLDPNEYLGGGNGLASQTQILKQADVVLMLNLFPDDHSDETVRANWEYYEPRTEHGSSLSACAYAMVAARIGRPDWAYDYFMKTATVDLTGKSKQFVGTLYIGGTHPAANGGAWMSAVFGFAGLRADKNGLSAHPRLPSRWNGMEFRVEWRGQAHRVSITHERTLIEPCENRSPMNEETTHPLKNRPELSLPLLDRKMVIAHYMTMMTYSKDMRPNESLFDLSTYPIDGPAAHVGGMMQHIPMIAHFHGASATLEESAAHEIRAAVELGIDGFQFYFPDRFDTATRDDTCAIVTTFLKVAAEQFPGFKLTVCPSHPDTLSEAQNIENFAIVLNRILDETRSLDSWLKTPDGRTIIYLWAPECLAESVTPESNVDRHPERMADVAEAYEKLARACGIKAAFIYHLRDEWAGNKALLEEALDYFPAVWGFVPTSDQGDAWEHVFKRCRERGRLYTQSAFNDFYTSKFHDKIDEWRVILHLDECLDGCVDDYWKRYLPCDLSRSFRRQLQRAVDWDVPIINVVTWNDYPEGHHMTPEIHRNFGFALLLKHFKNLWLGRPEENAKEWAAAFFKKYRRDIRPDPFDFEIRLLREESADEDFIELITWLHEPARLRINATDCGVIPAGLHETRIPSEPGHIRVLVERDGASVIDFETPMAISGNPSRTDLTTCTYSSEFMSFFSRLFPGLKPDFTARLAQSEQQPKLLSAGGEPRKKRADHGTRSHPQQAPTSR